MPIYVAAFIAAVNTPNKCSVALADTVEGLGPEMARRLVERASTPTLQNEAEVIPSEQKQQHEQQQHIAAPSVSPSGSIPPPNPAEYQPQDHEHPKQ